VSNLSKGKICSNYFLSICPRFLQPFTALPKGRAPKALRSRISSSDTSRGPAIDILNIGGGRCQTFRQHPRGGLPSTSSTSVVAAVGPCRQQPLGGPPSTSSTSVVAAAGPPEFGGGRCRTLPPTPPWGPPSTSSTLVVTAAGPAASTPQGARHQRLQLSNLELRHLPRARRQRFLALMVSAPGPPAPAPPRIHRRLSSKKIR
jgi:hypothetical protein